MNLVVLHSPHQRCGIAEYGRQLDLAFCANGAEPQALTFALSPEAVLEAITPGSILLVHFEPVLAPPGLAATLRAARKRGAKIVFSCHWFDPAVVLDRFGSVVDRFVLHREYQGLQHPQVSVLALGCPTYEPTTRRAELRARFELPQDAVVVTTQGFLSPWKLTPQVTKALLVAFPRDLPAYLQILTAVPYHGDASHQVEAMKKVLAEHPEARGYFSSEFRPEVELLDRLHASDLGFVYHGQHTGSVSAATKAYVAARCPLVVTESSHASDVQAGIVRVQGFDVQAFAREVWALARDGARREGLRAGMQREYERLSMVAVAKKYLDLFGSL